MFHHFSRFEVRVIEKVKLVGVDEYLSCEMERGK